MFYSTDLLSVRGGGKFNLVWMLSSTNNVDKLAKGRKKDILALKISATCDDLLKLFPVTGKFSYDICVFCNILPFPN